MTRVEVKGRAFVVSDGKFSNVLGYLTPEEIMELQRLAMATTSAGITWQEWEQRFGQ